MRYTSDAAMEEGSLRDVERWKDKIEVRLDNRQVFFLFFGSALVACLLFILGVIVGKRLESRGKAVAPEIEDPLALLDKVAAAPAGEPTAPAHTAAPKTVTAPPAHLVFPAPAPVHPAAAKAPPKPAAKPVGSPAESSDPEPAHPAAPSADASKSKARFALQLGSFPDRAEAEAFAQKFGGQAYVIASDIPGKGVWYRVRVGDYASTKDAIAAKASFEKQHSVIAYVVGAAPSR